MAEQIEMLFGLWTQVVPRYHVLDGNPDPPQEGAILRERKENGSPLYSIRNTIHVRRQCGFLSNYFYHLLNLGHIINPL